MTELSERGRQLWGSFADQLRTGWARGERLGVETLLQQQTGLEISEDTLQGLIVKEFRLRQELGERPAVDEYLRRFPQLAGRLAELLTSDGPLILPADSVVAPVITASDVDGMSQATLIGPSPNEPRSAGTPAGAASAGHVTTGMLLGPYHLLDKLGQGGMGAVYKARQTKLNKLVALKVLPPQMMENAQAVARFEREMQAVGKLEHPNIVRAMDANESQGIHYLAMEYVEGSDLERLVRDRGPFSVPEAIDAIRQAALGLQEAHEMGLVHRDIKPSNMLWTKLGQLIKGSRPGAGLAGA